jgi:hypothetical protein
VKLNESVAVGVTVQGPYRPLTFVVIVTVYCVLFARLDVGSIVTILKLVASNEVALGTFGLIVIAVLSIDGGCIGMENIKVIVLLTGTLVAVSDGSEEDISNGGTLDAYLYARSIAITVDAFILYYVIL